MLAGTRLANVWEETAVAAPSVPALAGSEAASVLVIGAGYLGLSAALHLADAGVDVLVVDAEQPGWGASGRNGGQVPSLTPVIDPVTKVNNFKANARRISIHARHHACINTMLA